MIHPMTSPARLHRALGAILCGFGFALPAAHAATMPPALADLAAKVLPAVVSVASTEPVTDNSDSDGDDNGGDSGGGDSGGDNGGSGSSGGDQSGAFHPDHAADTSGTSGSVLPPPKAEEALGSGFVFDPSGYILTNNHVIAGASSVTVTFQDGTILPAQIIGRDKSGDLAVLKVDAGHKLAAVQFGDSTKLRVGDWVMAVGNPFGLPGTTSAGIVSALDRNISEDKYDDFIQTDATINRGNSGGPLFDLSGHVIGVNSAIYSPSGGSIGIGFAIPSAMAAPVAAALLHGGSMNRGWLGVSAEEVTPEIVHTLALPGTAGALVGGISPHGPADGKLQAGDDLVSLGGVAIKDTRGLMIRTAQLPAGTQVPVRFWRDGSAHSVSLTVAVPPTQMDSTQAAPPAAAPGNVTFTTLGMALSADTSDAGLQVMSVKRGGPAAAAGLAVADTIEQLNGVAVGSAATLQGQLKTLMAAHQPAVLLVSGYDTGGNDPGPRWVAIPLK